MGKYINNNLINGEYLVFETNYHWILYFNHLILSIITLGIYPYLISKFSEFGITNKRLIIKTGVLSRKTLELNLSKIESVIVNQSILGRILGYGSIGVIGTGGTKEYFVSIKNPLEFRRKFQELSNKYNINNFFGESTGILPSPKILHSFILPFIVAISFSVIINLFS